MAEARGITKGVLTQSLGPWKRPVAYLSKWLDPVAAGWPGCLRAVTATTILVKEASKLTLGQDLQVVAPHSMEALLQSPPQHWLSNTRIPQYQVLLLDPPQVSFLKTAALNPATLLPDDNPKQPLHDCTETLSSLKNLREDLMGQTLMRPCIH